MQQSLTDSEIYNILELPFWNKSWFARELYEGKKATPAFHSKLKNGGFTFKELNKLNRILKRIAETEI